MSSPGGNRAYSRAIMPLGLFVFIGVAAFALLTPSLRQLIPPCAFYELTGLYCPGCGSGRAMYALTQFDLATAIRMNALSVLAIGPVVYVASREGLEALGAPVPPRILTSPRWGVLVAALVIAFWILRNVPIWPLSWLAPG